MSKVTTFVRTSRAPMPYDRLHPGSAFCIHAERSRGMMWSRDSTVYRRATDGYYSTDPLSGKAIVLYPEDLVWPLARKKA